MEENKKCPLCEKELNQNIIGFLNKKEIIAKLGDENKEDNFYLERGMHYEIYMRIGSCFYCDSRRLTKKYNLKITP